jgi:hypothetical protein
MQTTPLLLLGLAIIVCLLRRSRLRIEPIWSHLKGWHKVLGLIAFVLTLLIILNPELLPLGLLGDTAFFDMLVFALSLQMHRYVTQAFRWCAAVLPKAARRVGIPSPGFSYLLAMSALAIGSAVSTIQKAVHRICS